MKRWMIIVTLALALVAAFGAVAWAQGPNPTPGTCPMGFEPGTGPGHGPGMGPRTGGGMPDWAGHPETLEQLLGMTDAEIHAARQAGQSLAEIAAGKGVSEATLVNAILDAKKADLDQAVAEGKLTQAQADVMYQRMQTQVPVMINRTAVGPMERGGMMPGFRAGQGQPSNGMPRGGMGPRWAR